MNRRLFLAALGTTSTTALAGCLSVTNTTSSEADISVRAAEVSGRQLNNNGWQKVAELEQKVLDRKFAFVDIEVYSHTTQYEDRALRRRLREGTMGFFDATVMQFFTSRIEVVPALDELPFGVGLDTIMGLVQASAESQLKSQMDEQGLKNIREGQTGSININNGPQAWLKTYSADFEYPSMEFPITDDQKLTIPSDSLSVWGALSAWKSEDSILVAGGACPAQEFTQSLTRGVTELITVTVDIDLRLRPEQLKREIRNLIRTVR
jgi:uncharacterized protein YceK